MYVLVERVVTFPLEFMSIFSQIKIHTYVSIHRAPKLVEILVMIVVLKLLIRLKHTTKKETTNNQGGFTCSVGGPDLDKQVQHYNFSLTF